MTDDDIKLSRRKILAGLGTIGVASAGAGLGTTAWLSDEESFLNNVFTAGTLDLLVDYEVYEYQGSAGDYHVSSLDDVKNGTQYDDIPPVNGGDEISQELADVKPGDYGYSKFCFTIDTNPAYLWACGALQTNDENSVTEPEAEADGENNDGPTTDDIDGDGELADAIQVAVYYCDEDDDVMGDRPSEGGVTEDAILTGSLAEVLAALNTGLPLDGDGDTDAVPPNQTPFEGSGDEAPENPCLCFAWEVPTSVENEIQSDSVSFDLTFHAVQSRHNDGRHNPCCDCAADQYAVTLPDGQVCCVTPYEGESVESFYDYEGTGDSFETPLGLGEAQTTTLTLFDDGDDLSLVVIHDDGGPNGGGVVSVDFVGTVTPSWTVKDDPGDAYDGVGGAHWGWSGGKTDGGAANIGSSSAPLSLVGTFAFNDDADQSGASVTNPAGDVTSLRVVSNDESVCSVDVDADGDTFDVVVSDMCPTAIDVTDPNLG